MQNVLPLTIQRINKAPKQITLNVQRMFNAGWAGRDRKKVQEHIDELVAIGVSPPKHVPTLFALGNYLLTTANDIQVHGDETSGEVEYVLFWHQGEIFVTVGSDHTDRKLEQHSIPKAKNLCLNVMALEAWPYAEVKDHFEELLLECSVTRQGRDSLYQKDHAAALIEPEEWIEILQQRLGELSDGTVFFSGAIGTLEGLVTGEAYTFSLVDPVLKRSIHHRYDCQVLTGAIEDY